MSLIFAKALYQLKIEFILKSKQIMTQKPSYKELECRVRELEDIVSGKHPSLDTLLLENRYLLSDLIENSGTLIVIKDRDGKYLLVNRKWEQVTGLQCETVLGKTDAMLFSPEMARQFRGNDLRVIESGSMIETEECLETPTETRYFISSKFPLHDHNGKVAGLYGVITEITDLKRVEKALQQSQAKYHSLFDSAQVALFRTSMKGRLLEINNRYASMAGYSSVEQCMAEFNPGQAWADSRDRAELIRILRKNKSISDYEARIIRKDGEIIWILFSATIYPEQGYIEGSIIEITGRKQTELALNQSEAFQRRMVANIGDVIVIIDRDCIIRYKSSNIEKMFGWSPDEVVGTSMLDNVHPEDLAPVRSYLDLLMREPHDIRKIEFRYKCKDGTYKWIEFTGSNLLDDPDIHGLLGNYHDIMERKLAEQELLDSEARFKVLHNASFGGIAIHDNGIILECNQGLSKITGYSMAELMGMNGLLLIAENSRKTVMEKIVSGYEKPYEAIGLRKDGTEVPIRLEARNIPYKGKLVRTVEFRDISESKRSEDEKMKLQEQLIQAQKMESVGRLAGGVAHDFNNMLSVILGHAELAMEQLDPAQPIFADLQQIRQAADRSADITKQLLAFARKQVVAPKVIDLNKTVAGMLKMLLRLIGEDIDLAWLPGKGLWPIKIDPSQIDQILANLCVNSRDAISGVGKITVETENCTFDEEYCSVHSGFVSGQYLKIGVSDNGSGMDKETVSHIFEPFFTTKDVNKGTGLGLATVYGIVKQNNGFINVYSEQGQGTTIKIYLPRHVGTKKLEHAEFKAKPDERGKETILLVEDEPTILQLTTTVLQRLGYTVLVAGTPIEAIRLSGEYSEEIHLLLTDVIMPGMNGQVLTEKLIVSRPELKCLFMSGYSANVITQHGVLDDGVYFIQKPFAKRELAAKIRQALGDG
ncbi:MAG: PAS domain S-box protein [Proteobacteria bacterium]|nr:PAS domain S-box protein [Pseudomonadota bacterium]MBU1057695.1 PAS domain S-box protein [Pseudomonadota bacterium]